jgi:hypothetical protein
LFDLSKPKQDPVVLIRVATSDELLAYENRTVSDITLRGIATSARTSTSKESTIEDSFFIKCDIDDTIF